MLGLPKVSSWRGCSGESINHMNWLLAVELLMVTFVGRLTQPKTHHIDLDHPERRRAMRNLELPPAIIELFAKGFTAVIP